MLSQLLVEFNKLGSVDIIFFVVLAALIGLAIGIYFLIPVFNKKQYREQRENLKKREVAFKTNAKTSDDSPEATEETVDTEAVAETVDAGAEATTEQSE